MDRIAIVFCSGGPLRHRDAFGVAARSRGHSPADDAPLTAGAIRRRMV